MTPDFFKDKPRGNELTSLYRENKTLFWAAVAGALLVAGMVLAAFTDSERPTERPGTVSTENLPASEGYARTICERAVRDELVAPSTAKFERVDAFSSGTNVKVTGYVDAQNSLGGTVRMWFECSAEGQSDDLRIIDLIIE